VYAAALTPVIVAAVTEFLHRPVDLVTQLREERRTMVLESRQRERVPARGDEPLRGAPDFAQGDDAPADDALAQDRDGSAPPVRIHGRSGIRRVHPKVWIATGLVAFAVAAAALTLPELIFGGAVASEDRTTFFGGGGSSDEPKEATPQTTTEPAPTTVTETVPSQTPPSTETETSPTPTQTETTPAPSGGTPAPEEPQPEPAPEGALPALP
jgi:hypothetical protein